MVGAMSEALRAYGQGPHRDDCAAKFGLGPCICHAPPTEMTSLREIRAALTRMESLQKAIMQGIGPGCLDDRLRGIEQGLDKLLQGHAALAKQQDEDRAAISSWITMAQVALSGQLKGLGDGLALTVKDSMAHVLGLYVEHRKKLDTIGGVLAEILAAKPSKKPPRPAKRGKR